MPQLEATPKTIPAKACQFTADLEMGKGSDGGNVPIKLVARSGEPVDNWYWGRIVHDFTGMTIPKPSIPLDYCHHDDEVLGFADQFSTESGGLVAEGELVPFPDKPDDRAKEVIFKSGQGVPYEASIFFDGPLSIEEVGEGATTEVNGKTMPGPLTVVRQWTLRGIAVCPYGCDPNTSAAMKFARAGDIQAHVICKDKKEMSAPNAAKKMSDGAAPASETPAGEAPKTETKPAEGAATPEQKPEEKPAEKPAESTPPANEQKPAEPGTTVLTDGQRFLKEFGPQGGVWYAEGKTFAEAQKLHTDGLAAANQKLSKENEDLKKQLGANRGEETPVSFSGGGEPVKKLSNLPDGLTKFANAIKIPGAAPRN